MQGKELSYTNLLDLDAAARIVLEFDEPAAAVIKHTNPCGVATGVDDRARPTSRARDADALSAFGGIIGLNRTLDVETAQAIIDDVHRGRDRAGGRRGGAGDPGGEAEPARRSPPTSRRSATPRGPASSCARSSAACSCRSAIASSRRATPWPGAAGDGLRVVTKRQPTAEEWQALRFAWRVCAHVKSNTILFAGAGSHARRRRRPDEPCRRGEGRGDEGRRRASTGSVVASDAFFPFRDGLDAVAAAGATAVVQPGGSVKDAEVIAAADEHGLAMVFTGRRHFRH